jgi:hypothetical protein
MPAVTDTGFVPMRVSKVTGDSPEADMARRALTAGPMTFARVDE